MKYSINPINQKYYTTDYFNNQENKNNTNYIL